MTREWYTPAELAELKFPGLPDTERGIRKQADRSWRGGDPWHAEHNPMGRYRRRQGRGGGWEYHISLLPATAQAKLVVAASVPAAQDPRKAAKADIARGAAWEHYERCTDKKKAVARDRLTILEAVETLRLGGVSKDVAVITVGAQRKVGVSTIHGWFQKVAGKDRADWLPYLIDQRAGRSVTEDCTPDAWEMLKGDYLRAERPTFESCYRRVARAAADHGWTIPSERTLQRKLEREIAKPVIVLARQGLDALKQMYPPQERDRSVFHALEAVNADGHRWDVWVTWPDGEVSRPCMTAIQDLYSGMMLSWRIDKSENWGAFRLAFADLVEGYGIPDHAWLDNGRNFAAKWMTGGIANRYRFKVREEEPVGILTQLGVEVHWTTPYSGQSKPIERMFRDFCDTIAKHPALAGAWTGNTPLNKPENYRSKAIDLDVFSAIVAEGIAEHNARPGRKATCCAGRSFAETFRESYERSPIQKATEEQRRLWLLAAEGVKASGRDGALKLMGNRFWADFLALHTGQPLVVRFDPEALADGVHVYRLDGSYLGYAACNEATGFNDVTAAREHGKARRQWLKAQRAMLDAERKLNPAQVAALLPTVEPPAPPVADVVKLARPAVDLRPTLQAAPERPEEAVRREALVAEFKRPSTVVESDPATVRFERALRAERQIAAGEPVAEAERAWVERYRDTPEYRARRRVAEDFEGFGSEVRA